MKNLIEYKLDILLSLVNIDSLVKAIMSATNVNYMIIKKI